MKTFEDLKKALSKDTGLPGVSRTVRPPAPASFIHQEVRKELSREVRTARKNTRETTSTEAQVKRQLENTKVNRFGDRIGARTLGTEGSQSTRYPWSKAFLTAFVYGNDFPQVPPADMEYFWGRAMKKMQDYAEKHKEPFVPPVLASGAPNYELMVALLNISWDNGKAITGETWSARALAYFNVSNSKDVPFLEDAYKRTRTDVKARQEALTSAPDVKELVKERKADVTDEKGKLVPPKVRLGRLKLSTTDTTSMLASEFGETETETTTGDWE